MYEKSKHLILEALRNVVFKHSMLFVELQAGDIQAENHYEL